MPIKALTELPLLRFRNVPSGLSLAQKKVFVRNDGLPPIENPQHFVQTMQRWEQTLGTTYAALGGMVMMSGSPHIDQIIEGFETFNFLCLTLSPLLGGTTIDHLQALFNGISEKLVFEPAWPNLLEGLNNFEDNLAGDGINYAKVGDCVVCAAIFSLLYSFAGGLAGEAHRINNPHTTAFLEPHGYYYEGAGDKRLLPLDQRAPLVISGLFSFIANMTLMNFVSQVQGNNINAIKTLPKEKLEYLLSMLNCAEAINPYHLFLYNYKELVLAGLGRLEEADFSEIYEALGNFGQRPVKAGLFIGMQNE